MRILYLTTIASTMPFFKAIIGELVTNGHIVDIATSEIETLDKFYEKIGCKGFNIDCSRSPFNIDNIKSINQIKIIVLHGKYDVVHCHTPIAAACTRLACRNLRKSGLKVIYTAHGFHFYKGAPLLNWLLFYPVEKLCARFTDVLITINKEDYGFANKHLHAKEVKYVPGVGIDTDFFKFDQSVREQKREDLGLNDNDKVAIVIGELNENKNQTLILKALKKCNINNLKLLIVGDGPLRQELEKESERLGIDKNVHFLGFRKDVRDLYCASDFLISASQREGLPVCVMEAMSMGLPVICANIRGCKDLITDNVNGLLFESNNVEQLTEAICKMTNDVSIRKQFATNNIKKSNNYSYDTINKMIQEIYEEANESNTCTKFK